MRYVPFGQELEGIPHVLVGGRSSDSTTLDLSHWPRSQTPSELQADTSAEGALNYLRSPRREDYSRGAEAVSSGHYSIASLMAIWALLNPGEALERSELLVAVAECGDFDRWAGERAANVTCALRGLVTSPTSPVSAGSEAAGDRLARTALLYQRMLPLVTELIDNLSRFQEYWRDEYQRVERDRERFARGEATVQETRELDLAAFQLPDAFQDMALYEQTPCSRVVLMIEEHRYDVRYRYESWAQLRSQQPPPRIDLRPFADLLQTFEGNPGEWTADEVYRPRPRLRLCNREDDAAPSSITPGLFVRLLAQYLRENEANPALLWSPWTADVASLVEAPREG